MTTTSIKKFLSLGLLIMMPWRIHLVEAGRGARSTTLMSAGAPLLQTIRRRTRRGKHGFSQWNSSKRRRNVIERYHHGASIAADFGYEGGNNKEERNEKRHKNYRHSSSLKLIIKTTWRRVQQFMEHHSETLLLGIRLGLIAWTVLEMIKLVSDIIQEFDTPGDVGALSPSSSTSRNLSDKQLQTLLLWLQEPAMTRLPRTVPSWLVTVAVQLSKSGVPIYGDDAGDTAPSLENILPKLTKSQALFLSNVLYQRPKHQHTPYALDRVGGLGHVKQALRRRFHDRWQQQEQHTLPLSPYHKLLSSTKAAQGGMLLYGPPGCGKSLLIESIVQDAATHGKLPTLMIQPSTLQSKYYGESNQMVRLLFQVIAILGNNCIVVLDEVDGLFRERNQDEHEVSRTIKTEFLQSWQGIASSSRSNNRNNQGVTFIGATNRPFDVDPAVLRRLPQSFFVGLPPLQDRRELLLVWCREHDLPMDPTVLEQIAQATHLYSPSDMFHVLLEAAKVGPLSRGDRHLTMNDVRIAMASVPASKFSPSYVQKLQEFMQGTSAGSSASGQQSEYSQQQQKPHQIGKWETPLGNFYHVGHVATDESATKAFHDMVQQQHQDLQSSPNQQGNNAYHESSSYSSSDSNGLSSDDAEFTSEDFNEDDDEYDL
jgi:ATPase family AAA domain-containing protein 1